ncbi:MAG: ABC transporter ATP-binding protein [Agrobacterium albertimagni]|uniref:Iron ABC transporter ATP-binding protein n=1 Tax=Agrobacterium albertimagni AOL15 TaxID=1156935 RepID=K2Q9B9_9HYPH|nr:ABC transporter ATP-binding protein [Agrobacterium albertimagni]EKF60454.1 iron ABC transporter ATP-binding protein [Agrobacterium albertimagni AOL15]
MSITADTITWKIGSKIILDQVSFATRPGEMLGLLGPNGSGKTSLLRLLAGLKRPHTGAISLDGQDIQSISRKTMAQRVAFVEQHATTNANLKVVDVVKLGRFPHRSMFSAWTAEDQTAVEQALKRAGMVAKRDHSWQSLSGGERQRAHIARALAQAPKEIILDEPTNHLDVQHQIALLSLISDLPLTSVIALHDLNHAAMFCDRLLVLKEGRIVACGTPEEVLTKQLLRDVFSIDAHVEPSAHHGRPLIQFTRTIR